MVHRLLFFVLIFASFFVLCRAGSLTAADDPQATLPKPADRKIDFAREVAPIFRAHCYDCHGADLQESGLRLDRRRGPHGDSGLAIVPGKSAESLLIRYVAGLDPEMVMPPDGERLTNEQIAVLRAWIDQGAIRPVGPADEQDDIQGHWAYQPIRPLEPPAVNDDAGWVRNPIDAFVLARLREAGMTPAPEADRITLIRRLSLDLLGLPPTPEEVAEFVNDSRPEAYEELVDRLLASEHFGERWGRHWLDLARYADSDGYEKDRPRPTAWKYRDWVIDAINRDLPFDRFTIEQLAGDLLDEEIRSRRSEVRGQKTEPGRAAPADEDSRNRLIATAFHRQTLTNTEGGTDQEEFRIEAVFDRVNTTGAVWLGLTVGCAQCHSHKYDRISQVEYYRLFAFFNNGDEANLSVPNSDEALAAYRIEKAEHDRQVAALKKQLDDRRAELAAGQAEWEAEQQARLQSAGDDTIRFHPLEIVSVTSSGGATFKLQKDGSYLASGKAPQSDTYTIVAKTDIDGLTGFKLEALSDPSLPAKGPGRVQHGNFVLNGFEVFHSPSADFSAQQPVVLSAAEADFSQAKWPVAAAIDGNTETGWAISPQMGQDHWAVFRTAAPLESGPLWLQFVLKQDYGRQHTLGRFRLQAMTGTQPGSGVPETVRNILTVAPEKRNPKQRDALLDYRASLDATWRDLSKQLDELKQKAPAEPVMQVAVIAQRSNLRKTHILRRGDFLQPQAEVAPGPLDMLHPLQSRHADGLPDRLDLAHWLMDAANPLTPRVTVNRVWAHLFGRGLVRTPADFGVRGEQPSHPDLLDWLAAEFMEGPGSRVAGQEASGQRSEVRGQEAGGRRQEAAFATDHGPIPLASSPSPITPQQPNERSGTTEDRQRTADNSRWSRKAMIRRIVMSSTYRQSSRHRPEYAERDPQNRLLHRQNRFRVEGEIVRDLSLAAAGLLSRKVGGPSVFPPMPADVAALSYANNFRWTTSPGEDRYRRGLYTFFKRTAPHPNLTTFDCPDANTSALERDRSNTPLQALTTLNNEVFVEAAQGLAGRVLALGTASETDRLEHAFRLCVARLPSDREREQLLSLLTAARAWYEQHPTEAKQMAGRHLPKELPVEETAAWTATARVLLNLDEFITRE